MRQHYDVVVIGAGIHGVGVAQAAAAAGYSTLVLEQTQIAIGSSSRSSKLIHGGLRYLETGQLRLVRESLHERATLLRIAPELVHLKRFFVPVYQHTRRRPWQLRIGLSLYALLAGLGPTSRFGTVPRRDWGNLDGLDVTGLQAVFWYQDAQTDDRLLSQAVIRSAEQLGAELRLPARFTGATRSAANVSVHYEYGGTERECDATVLVNAAGPWAGATARLITPAMPIPSLELVQGSHIVLPGPISQGVYYVESPRDGRAVFIMPWHDGQALIGTTEVRFHGDPATVHPSSTEIHYLLGVARHYFPRFRESGAAEPSASFAGLRVLPAGGGHAFYRSRETLLIMDDEAHPRVLTIYGGKLTTWRAVAQRVIGLLKPSLPQSTPRARTDELMLRAP
jgi:glycerol-3-phosphate dehydrogenase